MRRAAATPQEDSTCSTSRVNYRSIELYERNLKPTLDGYANAIRSITGSTLETWKNSNQVADTQQYTAALNNMTLLENNLEQNMQCIQKDILQRNLYSSRLYTLQQEIETTRKELEQKKGIVSEAKERASLVQNPYSNTTWWETWFPLGRPIKKDTVPVLLAVSIFMLVFSLGIFLRFAGLELQLIPLQESTTSFLKIPNSRKYQ
jgi:hypothetical protein